MAKRVRTTAKQRKKEEVVRYLDVPIEVERAADNVAKMARKEGVHRLNYMRDPTVVRRLLYVRWLGDKSIRLATNAAGIDYIHFKKKMIAWRRSTEDELKEYEKLFIKYWNEFSAKSRIEILKHMREVCINADQPYAYKMYLETVDPPRPAPKERPNQTNIQINNYKEEVKELSYEELCAHIKEIQNKLPKELISHVQHDDQS